MNEENNRNQINDAELHMSISCKNYWPTKILNYALIIDKRISNDWHEEVKKNQMFTHLNYGQISIILETSPVNPNLYKHEYRLFVMIVTGKFKASWRRKFSSHFNLIGSLNTYFSSSTTFTASIQFSNLLVCDTP